MNIYDFIKSEINKWGEDYVYELMDNGYQPVHTTRGWKWVHSASIVVNPFNQVSAT